MHFLVVKTCLLPRHIPILFYGHTATAALWPKSPGLFLEACSYSRHRDDGGLLSLIELRNTTASKVCVETDWCAQKRKKAALWRPLCNGNPDATAVSTLPVGNRVDFYPLKGIGKTLSPKGYI